MDMNKSDSTKFKKIYKIILLIIVLFLAWFILDNVLFDIRKEYKDEKYFHVSYLLVDSEKADSSIKLKDFDNMDGFDDRILDYVGTNVPVTKEGNFYVADFKTMNDAAYKKITDYFTSLTNVYAEQVSDIKVDLDEYKAYIPAKYYENDKYVGKNSENINDKNSPVQMEVLTLIDKKDLEHTSINLTISRFVTTKKTLELFENKDFIDIKLFDKTKKLSRDDLKIYINNSKYPLQLSEYSYSEETGVVRLNVGRPIEVRNIKIKVRKFYNLNFLNIFRIESVSAATAQIVGSYSVSGGSLSVGQEEQIFMPYMYGSNVQTRSPYGALYCGGPISDDFDCSTAASNYVNISNISTAWNSYLASSINTGTDPSHSYFALRKKAYHCDVYQGESCNLVNFDYLNFGAVHLSITFNPDYDWIRATCTHQGSAFNNPKQALALIFRVSEIDTDERTITIEYISTASSGGQNASGHFKLENSETPPSTGSIEVTKTIINSDTPVNGFSYLLYKNADCTGTPIAGPKYTDAGGHVTFDNLDNGVYCVLEQTSGGKAIRVVNGTTTTTDLEPYPYGGNTKSDKIQSIVVKGNKRKIHFANSPDRPGGEDYCLNIQKYIQNDDGSRTRLVNVPFTLEWNYNGGNAFSVNLGTSYTSSTGVASWRWDDSYTPCATYTPGGCYLRDFTITEGLNSRESGWTQYLREDGITYTPYVYGMGEQGIGPSGPVILEYLYGDIRGQVGRLCENNFGLGCGNGTSEDTGSTMPKCSDATPTGLNPEANVMKEFTDTKVYFCIKVKKEDENGETIDPDAFNDMVFEASNSVTGRTIRTDLKYNYENEVNSGGHTLASIDHDSGVVSFFTGDSYDTGVTADPYGFFDDQEICKCKDGTEDCNPGHLCNGPDKLTANIWRIREISAPTGYTLNDETILEVRPIQMKRYPYDRDGETAFERARKDCLSSEESNRAETFSDYVLANWDETHTYYKNASTYTKISDLTVNNSDSNERKKYIIKNKKLILQWFKKATDDPDTDPNDERLVGGAKFVARRHDNNKYAVPKDLNGDGRIGLEDRKKTKDSNGVEKLCYVVGSYQDSAPSLYFESGDVSVAQDGSMNGEVCVINANTSKNDLNYVITEIDSGPYYTFGATKELTIPANRFFVPMSDLNTFLNYSTEFEFEKKATAYDEFTGEELSKITFSIYRQSSSGTPIGEPLVLKEAGYLDDGTIVYDFLQGNNPTNKLHVSPTTLKFVIKHLPKDDYIIKEMVENTCEDVTDPSKCIGYYVPTNNDQRFTITKCSSDVATACSNHGRVTANIINTPTEIKLTKSDFYHEYDQADVAIEGNNVPSEFANDKERSDFDRIVFTLYDKDGTPLKLQFVANHGDCTSDNDYAEYRYIRGGTVGSTELHTCGGHIRITHLCRGRTYKVKEESVPENSVFVRENTDSTPIEQTYKVGCDEGDSYRPTTETKLIEDKPTRVTFEKRDAKYNYLIPDETTTFEVYRCPKGQTTCHPGDYTTAEAREAAGMELVKFYSRAVIPGDEEDPGIPVFKMMSYSDAQNRAECQGNNTSNCYVTSVHPYVGKLIFRYLSSGSTYVLLETAAPKNYLLPEGRRAETEFTVRTDTVSVEEVNVPNQPTGILIRKYDDEGRLLGGAKFRIKLVTNYNPNKKPQDQEAVTLKFKTIKQGVYEYRPVLDSDLVITCEGPNCSDTSSFTLDRYKDIADFDTLFTSSGEMIKDVLKEGTALIQYVENDHYYVIEEVEAPKGHSLPEGDDRFTLIHVGKNTTVIEDTQMKFINYPTPFTFYKFDEYNSPLDGGKFKLQKLNENKSYITLNVTKVEGEDSLYKVDNTSTNDIIETTNGKATVYYLEEGQYRIVEVEAPPGKELPKKTLNVATFFVDKDGNVFGENIITNKPPTDKKKVKPSAQASLLINIQTGRAIIKYGIIIAALVAAITGLMIYMKKRK